MTVESSISRIQYAGNDSATAFAVPWQFLDDGHVAAVLTSGGEDTVLTLGVDYSLTGAGETGGGTLTFPLSGDPLATGQALTIHSSIPLTQEKAWSNTDSIDVTEIEKADDKLTRICRQLSEELGRCLKYPVSEAAPDTDIGSVLTARDLTLAARDQAVAAASNAEAWAAGVNMPAIESGDGDKALFAKADETGLEYKAPADARAALGLGTAAVADTGAGQGDVPVLDANGLLPQTMLPEATDDTARLNIVLLLFRMMIEHGLSVQDMVDGFADEFEDQTGIDTGDSSGQTYVADADCYRNYTEADNASSATYSSDDSGTAFSRLYDGDTSTAWISDNGTNEVDLYVEFASAVALVKMALAAPASYEERMPTAFTVKGSATGTWAGEEITLLSVSGLSWTASGEKQWRVTDPDDTYQYYCLTLTDKTGSFGYGNEYHVGYLELHVPTLSSMSLITEAVTAAAQPDDGWVVALAEGGDDLAYSMSRDGGTSWTAATLEDQGISIDGYAVLAGSVDLSSQPSGTSMALKATATASNFVRLHAHAGQWSE